VNNGIAEWNMKVAVMSVQAVANEVAGLEDLVSQVEVLLSCVLA